MQICEIGATISGYMHLGDQISTYCQLRKSGPYFAANDRGANTTPETIGVVIPLRMAPVQLMEVPGGAVFFLKPD